MKHFRSTILVLFLFSTHAFAQFESIDLNKYKLTDYKYKSLLTGIGLNNSNTYQQASKFSNINDVNLGGTLNFNSVNQTRAHIRNNSINFSTGFSFMEDDNTDMDQLTKAYGLTFEVYSSNWYYNDNNVFYGISFNSDQYANHYENEVKIPFESKMYNNAYFTSNKITLSIGKGRIENVTDARLAIYILDDLIKQGRLSITPSQEEVFRFADFITKQLNKRELDSRIKRIKEYVAIDSFLTSNGYITKMDGLAFGLISDNWDYARTQYWNTGSVFSAGITPSFDYVNDYYRSRETGYDYKRRDEFQRLGLGFSFSYSYREIKRLKWITGYNFDGGIRIYRYENTSIDYEDYEDIFARTNYFVSYIPNTRTLISFNSGAELIKNLTDDYNKEIQVRPFLSGYCNYYFSEKLRLNLNASVNYTFNKIYDPMNTNKRLNIGLFATLNYYIF